MTETSTNVFEWTGYFKASGEFKILTNKDSWDYGYNPTSATETLSDQNSGIQDRSGGDNKWKVASDGVYKITVNTSDKTIKAESATMTIPTLTDGYYQIGTADDLVNFADAINKKHNLGFEPTTVSLVANEFAHNPRRIIQMFNNLSVELQSLPKEFEEKHQNLVCLLLIIREEYPRFYAKVRVEPMALFFSDKRQDVSDEKINDFLNLNSAIIDSYSKNVFVTERILSNTPIEDRIPQTIKDDYLKKIYSKESLDYIAVYSHRSSLMHYVENRLNLAIKRGLWETDVKNNVDRLFALNQASQLSKEENLRVVGLISDIGVFDMIADKQTNLHNLIDYAAQLECQGVPLLASRLTAYISINGVVDDKYNENVDVWYACARLSSANVKSLKKVAQTFLSHLRDLKHYVMLISLKKTAYL